MESKTIGRPVQIRLHSSIQHPGQDKETHELQVAGQFIEKGKSFYIKYDEEQNGESIQTIVKVSENNALIMRNGAVTMRLPFDTQKNRLGEYGVGPANMNLLVKTNELTFAKEMDIATGQFNVIYELYAEDSLLGTYRLTLTYTEGTK